MFDVNPQFGALMNRWYDEEMDRLYGMRTQGKKYNGKDHITMIAPVWGLEYLETLCNYSLPTILSERNRDALKGRATLLLFTDDNSYRMLLGATHAVSKYGIELVVRKIPQYVMDARTQDPMSSFWILGVTHSIGMQYCVRWRTGFHMYVPDHAYSETYFERMERMQKKHDVILQCTASADIDRVRPLLEPFRHKDGSINISAAAMGKIAIENLHIQSQQYLMNNATLPDNIPFTQFQFWRMKNQLRIYTGFMNPVWMSYKHLCKVGSSSLSTLDTRMPDMMIEKFAVPGIEEEMVYLELSGKNKGGAAHRSSRNMWIDRAWEQMQYKTEYMSFRQAPSFLPIPEQPDNMSATEEQVAEMQGAINQILLEERGNSAIRRAQGLVVPEELKTWDIHKLD